MRWKPTVALSLAALGLLWGGKPSRAADPVQPLPNGIILQAVPGSRVLRRGKAIALEAGMLIYPGDRLQSAIGDPIWVQCDDLTRQTLAGESMRENNCPLASNSECPEDAINPHSALQYVAQKVTSSPEGE